MGADELSSMRIANLSDEMSHDITTILHYGRSMPRPLLSLNTDATSTNKNNNNPPTNTTENSASDFKERERFYSKQRDEILNELLETMNQTLKANRNVEVGQSSALPTSSVATTSNNTNRENNNNQQKLTTSAKSNQNEVQNKRFFDLESKKNTILQKMFGIIDLCLHMNIHTHMFPISFSLSFSLFQPVLTL
jgi:hypothetical protein